MNVFWFPPDVDCEAVCRLGGVRDELSLTVHSDSKISVPTLPVLFAYQIALWVVVRYVEVKPEKKQYCFRLEAQCAASLYELAKFVHGNVATGFCIAAPSHGKARSGLFLSQQRVMFDNYCEARTNLETALSNRHEAGARHDQAKALYLQAQGTWLKAKDMLESVENSCREAGFDPRSYLENETDA